MQLGNADLFEALNSSLMTSVSKFHEQLVEKEDYIATNLVLSVCSDGMSRME